jgi:hypothetical protein
MYPYEKAFSMIFKTQNQAMDCAYSKRKFGGAFLPHELGFIVYWLPKELAKDFAW